MKIIYWLFSEDIKKYNKTRLSETVESALFRVAMYVRVENYYVSGIEV